MKPQDRFRQFFLYVFKTTGANLTKLFWLTLLLSVATLYLFWHATFTKHADVPYALTIVVCSLVGIYTAPKELGRWANGGHGGGRIGEVVALAWILSLGVMAYMQYFWGDKYAIPRDMLGTTLVLLGLLGVSAISSHMHKQIRQAKLSENEKVGTGPPPEPTKEPQ